MHAFQTDCVPTLASGYLGLLPTDDKVNQSNSQINNETKIRTFSSRSFSVPSDFTSTARLRGPY